MRALIVVDVQNDFVSGSLATARGAAVASSISTHLAETDYGFVVGTQDWHIAPEGHFAAPGEQPDYSTTWPVHCVAEEWGAQPHANLDAEQIQQWFRKGEYTAAYSGFEATCNGVGLAEALRERGVTQLDVCGIATDFCVRATVLDGLREGFAVRVLQDLCAPVDEEQGQAVLQELARAGAAIR